MEKFANKKTSVLRKKLKKLYERADDSERKLVQTTLGIQGNLNGQLDELERDQIEKALEILVGYEGPAQTPSSLTTIEQDIAKWWRTRLENCRPFVHPDKQFLLDEIAAITVVENFGYEQGQIRPDKDLSRWDIYFRMVLHGWYPTLGFITGISKEEYDLITEMDKYGVDNPEMLKLVKSFIKWRDEKVKRGIHPMAIFCLHIAVAGKCLEKYIENLPYKEQILSYDLLFEMEKNGFLIRNPR